MRTLVAPRRDRLRSDGAPAVEPGTFSHAESRSRREREGRAPSRPLCAVVPHGIMGCGRWSRSVATVVRSDG
ncbi:MAG: hypothetical protein IJR99_02315, partial [Kiritimatiellae bacterium]|nr:hypothetical protein [Kiritimatiellia bacterium]